MCVLECVWKSHCWRRRANLFSIDRIYVVGHLVNNINYTYTTVQSGNACKYELYIVSRDKYPALVSVHNTRIIII